MKKIKLNNIPTHVVEKISKESVKKELEKLKIQLEELQFLMYAERKHALLVILQGLDASGKDGAVKNVFDAVNPMGCRVISFKVPTLPEQNHDFLWRIHQQVPEKGMICVFNRSQYEEVLIQRVHHQVSKKTIKQRFENINDFEKLLVQTGTHVLKFYLHISKKEQMKRLQERVSDPAKRWKYNKGDLKERKLWKPYLQAYEDVFENCSVHAPWYIIPADHNKYKEYLIAKKIVETLKSLNMKFPELEAGKKKD